MDIYEQVMKTIESGLESTRDFKTLFNASTNRDSTITYFDGEPEPEPGYRLSPVPNLQ